MFHNFARICVSVQSTKFGTPTVSMSTHTAHFTPAGQMYKIYRMCTLYSILFFIFLGGPSSSVDVHLCSTPHLEKKMPLSPRKERCHYHLEKNAAIITSKRTLPLSPRKERCHYHLEKNAAIITSKRTLPLSPRKERCHYHLEKNAAIITSKRTLPLSPRKERCHYHLEKNAAIITSKRTLPLSPRKERCHYHLEKNAAIITSKRTLPLSPRKERCHYHLEKNAAIITSKRTLPLSPRKERCHYHLEKNAAIITSKRTLPLSPRKERCHYHLEKNAAIIKLVDLISNYFDLTTLTIDFEPSKNYVRHVMLCVITQRPMATWQEDAQASAFASAMFAPIAPSPRSGAYCACAASTMMSRRQYIPVRIVPFIYWTKMMSKLSNILQRPRRG